LKVHHAALVEFYFFHVTFNVILRGEIPIELEETTDVVGDEDRHGGFCTTCCAYGSGIIYSKIG
jgi:hypothetical protein